MSLLATLTSTVLLASPGAAKELESLCKAATELVGQKPSSFKPERREDWYDVRWVKWRTQADALVKDAGLKSALETSAMISADGKLVIFQDFAKDIGLADWSCPALEKVLVPPDRDLTGLCDSAKHDKLGSAPFDSAKARAAWKSAQEKKGAEGFKLLQAAAEWPENAFKDCDDLKIKLSAMVAPPPAQDQKRAGVIPEVAIEGPISASGFASVENVEKAARHNLNQLRFCAASARPPVGTSTVTLTVGSSGRVESATVEAGAGGDPFKTCLEKRALTWLFPRPEKGALAKVTFSVKTTY